ncbi:OsmC family peroxiredoxin [Nitrosomonas sp. JL21]|uniref:OsmC family protein n=1 Tax=Nitrosomonas sp. JL21 TaxID=153949 RepID=UPI00136FA7A6|nr:OsmC family protein [Nitrosomonas sp. JL21]MBL8497696.1 OsmC family protein [Nitrosomonas sp.]MCC7091208.1 OsmC family protein [Nitrosomonas sp.]MXS78361.1 OsmC family peroxiredoxin [Nitrosomonas sp. JL21]
MTHSNNDIVNGIDPKRAQAILNLVRNDITGDTAKPEFRTTVAWDSGFHATMHVTDGQVVLADEPHHFGGEGMGITPEDLLLTAVGSCLVATYIAGLSAASINVEYLRLSVSGRVNFRAAFAVEPGSPGFEDIKVVVDLQTDAPEKEVTQLLQKLYKMAPIPDTILRPVPVKVEINHHSDTKASSP